MNDETADRCTPVELRAWASRLAGHARGGATGGGDRLELLRVMEELRSVLAAAQAAEVAALAAERQAEVEAHLASVPCPTVEVRRRREDRARRKLVAEVGLARRISPWQAGRFVAWACAAPVDTPQTFGLLVAGEVSERRAVIVQQVAAVLPVEDRRRVDAELAPQLPGWGDGKVDKQTRAAVYRADPVGACERAAYAEAQRRVTTRPAPDTMAWLTVLGPMPQIVACRAALEQAATRARAAGDPRCRGQVMADTLIERVTGQSEAAAVPVAIQLVITDRTLTGGDDPARFADGTPYPAPMARDLALGPRNGTPESTAARTVRRLFTDPPGQLVTAETRSRRFTPAMAEVTRLRDGTCTTPWCDAPIRHIDHHDPHTHGGPTSLNNAQGKCQWCNQTKGDQRPAVDITAPPEDCTPPHRRTRHSPLERRARRTLKAAARGRSRITVDLPHHRCTTHHSG